MPSVIVVANQKGGVSKTTTTANLAVALAEDGKTRVLAVDLDPQTNLSGLFGVGEDEAGVTYIDDQLGPRQTKAVVLTTKPGTDEPLPGGVHLIPCTGELASVPTTSLTQEPKTAPYRLRTLLETVEDEYDFILLDTPPTIGPFSSLAMMAATDLIIPSRPLDQDYEQAAKLYDMVEGGAYGDGPNILGVLFTQLDARWKLVNDVIEACEESEMVVIPVRIPFAIRTGSAPREGSPTIVHAPDGRVGSAYRDLGRWVREAVAA